jgi:glycosyltransferase involved in cell wall biosynthesis
MGENRRAAVVESVANLDGVRMPFVTVAIPTYRRLVTLRRAVASVFAQSFSDWEMVISDDEEPSGETWHYLEMLSKSDSRVRVIRNCSPHGACFNHNTALKAAGGEWIKILHDDDVLKTNCLEVLARIVGENEGAIAVSCAAEIFWGEKLVKPFNRRDRALLERLEPSAALLAMYILDESGWAGPSQQMVHRSIVESGILYEEALGIKTLFDSWFNARVWARGGTLVYNAPLVEWHQGQHKTITSSLTEGELTAEMVAFRRLVLSLIPKGQNPPALKTVEDMVAIVRALRNIRYMRFQEAIPVFTSIWDPHAYIMALNWSLRQCHPRRFSSIRRAIIWKNEAQVARGTT